MGYRTKADSRSCPLHQLMSACTLQFRIAVLKLGNAIMKWSLYARLHILGSPSSTRLKMSVAHRGRSLGYSKPFRLWFLSFSASRFLWVSVWMAGARPAKYYQSVGTPIARKSYPSSPFESRDFRKTFVCHFSRVMDHPARRFSVLVPSRDNVTPFVAICIYSNV